MVNTGDRLAARKALMQSFRGHLELYQTGGKHCSSCCDGKTKDSDAIEIDEMIQSKFRPTWRHSTLAWICFMGILLLAFIYAENTNWDDSWYRVPTKYNVTELLNADDDQIIALKPKIKEKKPKAAKNNIKTDNEVVEKKGKTAKNDVKESDEESKEKASKKV